MSKWDLSRRISLRSSETSFEFPWKAAREFCAHLLTPSGLFYHTADLQKALLLSLEPHWDTRYSLVALLFIAFLYCNFDHSPSNCDHLCIPFCQKYIFYLMNDQPVPCLSETARLLPAPRPKHFKFTVGDQWCLDSFRCRSSIEQITRCILNERKGESMRHTSHCNRNSPSFFQDCTFRSIHHPHSFIYVVQLHVQLKIQTWAISFHTALKPSSTWAVDQNTDTLTSYNCIVSSNTAAWRTIFHSAGTMTLLPMFC